MRKIWFLVVAAVAIVIAAGAAVFLVGRDKPDTVTASSPPPAAPPPAVAPRAAVPAASGAAGQSSQTSAAVQSAAPTGAATDTDHVLGDRNAPVTIIEYASLTCPHCAHFHLETLPQLKAEFLDSGKAKLIFRDYPLDQLALRAAALAECVPGDRYFGMLSVLFEGQTSWATAKDPQSALARLGKLGGLSDDQAKECMEDPKRLDQIVAERLEGEQQFAIRSTPTLIVNGKKLSGALSIEQLREIIGASIP